MRPTNAPSATRMGTCSRSKMSSRRSIGASGETVSRRVLITVDTGAKYLSKLYDDFWLADHGLLDRATAGDLTDLITRRFAEGAVVTTPPTDTLLTAYGLFKLYNVSQLPVVDHGRIVGIVDESDVLLAVVRDAGRFGDPVSSVMSTRLDTVTPDAPIGRLLDIFEREHVPILVAGGVFVGLITRIDILNYLRRKLK